MSRARDDIALDVLDRARADARPRARPSRRWLAWVFTLCALATISLALARSSAVARADRTSSRRLLGVYFQRRAAGSVGRLRAAHGFSASDGVARTARSANWVGDEIHRHVTFEAGSTGPVPETTSAAGSDSGWEMSDDNDDEEEKTSTALVAVESQVAADGASGDVPASSAETRVTSALETLGLEKGATKAQARKAYLNLARKWHPDKNIGNEEKATEKFKKLKEAWDVLDASLETPDDSGGGGGGGGGGVGAGAGGEKGGAGAIGQE